MQRWISPDPIAEAGGINLYGFVGNSPVDKVDPLGLSWAFGVPFEKIGMGGGVINLNGTDYPVRTRAEFIAALRTETAGGSQIEVFTYRGHGDPDQGGLLWAAKHDPLSMNGSIYPTDLVTYLTHFRALFSPTVRVRLKACGSANPNIFSAADAFKKVFPDSEVGGYTGLYLPYYGGVPNWAYFRNGHEHPNTPARSRWIVR